MPPGRKVPVGTGCISPFHEDMTQSQRRAHPHTSPRWLCVSSQQPSRIPFSTTRREGKEEVVSQPELLDTWHSWAWSPFWPGGRATCPRHFEDAYRYISTNTCIWFTSPRTRWGISSGHLWPWLWGRSGAWSTPYTTAATGRTQIGTAVQPWHHLPFHLWLSLTPTLGRGAHEKQSKLG